MSSNKTGKPKVNYIDNKEFLRQLLDYFAKCDEAKKNDKPDPPIPRYIGDCFLKIATNLSRAPNFAQYSYKDEMIMDGVENALMYFRNFDPKKSENPFSYFTQIVWYAFVRRIEKEKKQSYIKYKLTEQHGIMEHEIQEDRNEEGKMMPQDGLYDNMAEYIHNFEEKVEEKRNKRRKKKAEPQEELPDNDME